MKIVILITVLVLFVSCVPAKKSFHSSPYHESYLFQKDSLLTFFQSISYDVTNSIDEEYWENLQISIRDTGQVVENSVIKITDNQLVEAKYNFTSVWRFPGENNYQVYGEIYILKIKRNYFTVYQNVWIETENNVSIKYFRGNRNYKRMK
jgi:hypothetical protein